MISMHLRAAWGILSAGAACFTLAAAPPEQRWRVGLYLDQPEEWDDPYRFFRW